MNSRGFYIQELRLIPHPEGGYFREIWRSGAVPMQSKGATDLDGKLVETKRNSFLNDSGIRNEQTVIYWLAVKEQFLPLCHNISTHVHVYLGGSPFQYWIVDKNTRQTRVEILGPDLHAGHKLQVVVTSDEWKCGKVLASESCDYSLISEVVSPGFDYRDFKFVTKADLLATNPTSMEVLAEYLKSHDEEIENGFTSEIYDEN